MRLHMAKFKVLPLYLIYKPLTLLNEQDYSVLIIEVLKIQADRYRPRPPANFLLGDKKPCSIAADPMLWYKSAFFKAFMAATLRQVMLDLAFTSHMGRHRHPGALNADAGRGTGWMSGVHGGITQTEKSHE